MRKLTFFMTMAVAMLFISGCGGDPFKDVKKLNGLTRAEVKAKLGEPTKTETVMCEPAENAEQMALTTAIPAGHEYEVWSYKKDDATHLIYFADSADPKSKPEGWKVVLVSTVKTETLVQ